MRYVEKRSKYCTAIMAAILLAATVSCTDKVDPPKPQPKQIQLKSTIPKTVPTEPAKQLISYEVLKTWDIPAWHTPAGGTGLDILVSRKSTKDQVIDLAHSLRAKYSKENKFFTLSVFDLKEAWANRENESYPQAKYMKHFLATANVNPNTGYDQIQWTAQGRGY